MLFGAAAKYTDDLSSAVKRGNRAVYKEGRITGRAPIGYLKVREKAGQRGASPIEKDPERFDPVRGIWDAVLAGESPASAWRLARGRRAHDPGHRSFTGATDRPRLGVPSPPKPLLRWPDHPRRPKVPRRARSHALRRGIRSRPGPHGAGRGADDRGRAAPPALVHVRGGSCTAATARGSCAASSTRTEGHEYGYYCCSRQPCPGPE